MLPHRLDSWRVGIFPQRPVILSGARRSRAQSKDPYNHPRSRLRPIFSETLRTLAESYIPKSHALEAPMHYDFIAIPDADIPRAANPLFQHLLDTYAGETNKVIDVWRGFAEDDLAYRPHPKSTTVADILKHQLLSERRFFGEFVGTPEPPPADVLPKTPSLAACIRRMEELARPRLAFFAAQSTEWWMADVPVLRPHPPAHLGLLAARAAHLPSPHAAHGLSAPAQQAGDVGLRSYFGSNLGRRRSHELSRSSRQKVMNQFRVASFEFQVGGRGLKAVSIAKSADRALETRNFAPASELLRVRARLHSLRGNSGSGPWSGSAALQRPVHPLYFAFPSRLHRLLKNSSCERFVTGHDFSRADKRFISLLSRLQPAAQLPTFQQAVQSCRQRTQ